ncbi:hypothetical protein [Thiohalorhabdus methylotrophus]|uniref:Lipoprotein n=1 Tax=Thiohalorhabdus methylotrophus TaxID=3242694 RepID=A0ABV4U017_9GAMM
MRKTKLMAGTGGAACLFLTACSAVDAVHTAVDKATDAAVHGMTGKRSTGGGGTAGATPPPAALHGYTMGVFQAVFHLGGYQMAVAEFEPGDYIRWQARGYGEQGQWFKKSLLKRLDDGREWWRVVTHTGDGDEVVMEALLSAPRGDGVRGIRRLKVQWPGEQPREVPITEQEASRWALGSPRKLTEESYKGLKVGVENVNVPAGTFTADHLSTGASGQSGTMHWWVTDRVPGGIVKFEWKGEDASRVMALKDHGNGDTVSRLGAF